MPEPRARATKEERLLAELDAHMERLTAWEASFVESIGDQLSRGVVLSERQRSCLSEIYERRVLGW